MDPTLPKKRGRKKKIHTIDEVLSNNNQVQRIEVEKPNPSVTKQKAKTSRVDVVNKIERALQDSEKKINTSTIFEALVEKVNSNIVEVERNIDFAQDRVMRKFYRKMIDNLKSRDNGIDQTVNNEAINKTKLMENSNFHNQNEDKAPTIRDKSIFHIDEMSSWNHYVTFALAKKLCKLVSFLLELGPLNAIETKILEDCGVSLVSYYSERLKLIKENKGLYLNTTFFPRLNSNSYRFLTEVLGVSLNDLKKLY